MKLKSLFFLLILLGAYQAGGEESLSLGGSKNLSLLPMIAEQQGFYRDEGVAVHHEVISVGKLAMDAVLAGSVDIGVVVDTNLSFISFRDNDLRVLATILRHSTDGLIECSADLKPTGEDLHGKRIGYFPATTSHIFLIRWLQKNNMTMKDIDPIILQPTSMAQALKMNAVDAVSIWNPWRAQIKKQLQGHCDESSGSPSLYPSYAYLVVKGSTLEKKMDTIKRFIRALIRADDFVSQHEQEAITAYRSFTHMDSESTASVWHYSEPSVQLSTSAVEIISDTIRWLSENDPAFQGKPLPNPQSLFAPAILASIDPKRVTLIDDVKKQD